MRARGTAPVAIAAACCLLVLAAFAPLTSDPLAGPAPRAAMAGAEVHAELGAVEGPAWSDGEAAQVGPRPVGERRHGHGLIGLLATIAAAATATGWWTATTRTARTLPGPVAIGPARTRAPPSIRLVWSGSGPRSPLGARRPSTRTTRVAGRGSADVAPTGAGVVVTRRVRTAAPVRGVNGAAS